MTEYKVIPGGTVKWTRDAAANDSDKSFTVPAGKVWELISMTSELHTSATVGNRYLGIRITNGTNDIMNTIITAVVVASKYAGLRIFFGAPVAPSTTAFIRLDEATAPQDLTNSVGVGRVSLTAGCVVRIYDVSAIDAAADDLTVVLNYIEYDA